jgi:ribosome recycling factor
MPNFIDEQKQEFQAVIDHFQKELQGLRTGRASAGLVESIHVEVYGQAMELKAVASITTPDARTIQIEPWDKTVVKDVEKALVDADLGMQPTTAGTVIRLNLPPMTEENRKNLVKIMHQKAEVSRISVRNVREKIKALVTNAKKDKTISEDEERRELERLDKIVGEWNAKMEKMVSEKETEIMTV